jgi:NAD(P)-dependent dehydrogenase (short-subunit alcohol dehydrogenase family)
MTLDPAQPALKHKIIVVIGGTTGLGFSAASAFVAAEAKVVVVGLEQESTALASQRLGPACRAICADAIKPETAPCAIEEALNHFNGFHGLYHVAGGSGRRWGDGPLHELTNGAWSATLDLNLTAVMHSNRAAAKQFLQQGSGGTVLNMTSVLALSPSPTFFATHAYATAKAAVIGLTKSCAAFYAPHNIRFNALAPGLVATPMSRRAQSDPNISRFIRTKQPLDHGRIGNPSDLDAAAVYFMSDASRFTTGQVLSVDGGWSLSEGQIPTEA